MCWSRQVAMPALSRRNVLHGGSLRDAYEMALLARSLLSYGPNRELATDSVAPRRHRAAGPGTPPLGRRFLALMVHRLTRPTDPSPVPSRLRLADERIQGFRLCAALTEPPRLIA